MQFEANGQNLPAWARWIAQDADGTWWAYEHEPNLGATSWYENEVGRSICISDGIPPSDWKNTLQRNQ